MQRSLPDFTRLFRRCVWCATSLSGNPIAILIPLAGGTKNDLSDDFIVNAEFHLDDSSATWSGGIVLSEGTLYKNIEASGVKHTAGWNKEILFEAPDTLEDFRRLELQDYAHAMAPSKLPPPMLRRWKIDPNDPKRAVSYEEMVFSWEAYAIELLEDDLVVVTSAPAVVPGAPAPLPKKRLSIESRVIEEVNRRKAAGEKRPRRNSDFARDLAVQLHAPSRTIENCLSKLKL
jgi:hypothetical protein